MTKILPLPIAEISDDFGIHVCCEDNRCTHGVDLLPSELLGKLGPSSTFHDILNRMRCSRCGRRPVGIRQFYRLGIPG